MSENNCPRRDAGFKRLELGSSAAGAKTRPPCATPPSSRNQPAKLPASATPRKSARWLRQSGSSCHRDCRQRRPPVRARSRLRQSRGKGGNCQASEHDRSHGCKTAPSGRGCAQPGPFRALFAAAAGWLFGLVLVRPSTRPVSASSAATASPSASDSRKALRKSGGQNDTSADQHRQAQAGS